MRVSHIIQLATLCLGLSANLSYVNAAEQSYSAQGTQQISKSETSLTFQGRLQRIGDQWLVVADVKEGEQSIDSATVYYHDIALAPVNQQTTAHPSLAEHPGALVAWVDDALVQNRALSFHVVDQSRAIDFKTSMSFGDGMPEVVDTGVIPLVAPPSPIVFGSPALKKGPDGALYKTVVSQPLSKAGQVTLNFNQAINTWKARFYITAISGEQVVYKFLMNPVACPAGPKPCTSSRNFAAPLNTVITIGGADGVHFEKGFLQ